jgi:hypothetical protein
MQALSRITDTFNETIRALDSTIANLESIATPRPPPQGAAAEPEPDDRAEESLVDPSTHRATRITSPHIDNSASWTIDWIATASPPADNSAPWVVDSGANHLIVPPHHQATRNVAPRTPRAPAPHQSRVVSDARSPGHANDRFAHTLPPRALRELLHLACWQDTAAAHARHHNATPHFTAAYYINTAPNTDTANAHNAPAEDEAGNATAEDGGTAADADDSTATSDT